MADDPTLSFEQRQGLAPLPRQLELREISQELRAIVWGIFDQWIKPQYSSMGFSDPWLDDTWQLVFKEKWIYRDHQLAEFENDYKVHIGSVRKVIQSGDYGEFLGLLEWLIRNNRVPSNFKSSIAWALEKSRSAYRVVDRDTIMPITDPVDAETVQRALDDFSQNKLPAPRQHLKNAAEALTAGDWPTSIRESVHAVEATARNLVPEAKELGPALRALEQSRTIHRSLKAGFGSIYGFTSDEKGLRHPLIDDPEAKVDETDALFMIGACSAFVSYMLRRSKDPR